MSRRQSVFSQEVTAVLFEVWKWYTKIDLSGPCIPSEYEPESTLRGLVDLSLVEFPLVVYRDFLIITEEVWNSL